MRGQKTTQKGAPAVTQKLTQMAAALKVLAKAKRPMNCQQMVEAMAKQRLWTSPGGATPEATLYASILRDLRKGKAARFKKTAPGQFSLAKQS